MAVRHAAVAWAATLVIACGLLALPPVAARGPAARAPPPATHGRGAAAAAPRTRRCAYGSTDHGGAERNRAPDDRGRGDSERLAIIERRCGAAHAGAGSGLRSGPGPR